MKMTWEDVLVHAFDDEKDYGAIKFFCDSRFAVRAKNETEMRVLLIILGSNPVFDAKDALDQYLKNPEKNCLYYNFLNWMLEVFPDTEGHSDCDYIEFEEFINHVKITNNG